MQDLKAFIEYEIIHFGNVSVSIGDLISVLFTLLITMILIWGSKKAIFRQRVISRYEKGNLYSLFQIFKYVVWIIAILLIFDTLGVKLNVLLAGSAALLVGVGLGLQNTFNNFISGIILLFEGSIKVGDILELDGDVVKMERIGIRTSTAINRDDIMVIIPNSMFTTNKVINWTHQTKKTRFRIKVGVAYGSDVDLVLKILKESALQHPQIDDKTNILARFVDFGESSLDFELLFYSDNIFRIENVKSEIRKIINDKFLQNNITIPFPQLDLHFKSDKTGFFKPS